MLACSSSSGPQPVDVFPPSPSCCAAFLLFVPLVAKLYFGLVPVELDIYLVIVFSFVINGRSHALVHQ